MLSAICSRIALAGIAAALCIVPAAHAAVTISSNATSNMSCVSGVCTPTAANAVLNVGDLTSMLASGNVSVNTGTGSLAAQVEDIIVAATFNWASANALTLDAYRSVTVTAPVAVNGTAPVSLVTNDGGSGGNLSFVSGGSLSFLGTANSLSINGMAYTLENSIATLAAAVAHKPSGRYALSTSFDAAPDGTYKSAPIRTKFKGTFNGLGNAISNLTVNGNKNIGLFAYMEASGAINSLVLANAHISARTRISGGAAGAVVGANNGTVFNSIASGQINGALSSQGGSLLGGLVGLNLGTILNSSASSAVQATGNSKQAGYGSIGGLVGGNSGIMRNSFSTGNVSATGASTVADSGGLAGSSGGYIANCYSTGNATSSSYAFAGGLVGLANTSIVNSYSTGSPSDGGGYVGGLVGEDDSKGEFSDDYWDTKTSGITNLSQGAGSPANDSGIKGETTARLKAALPAGFDPTIWAENPSINDGLPYLINNPPR